ncbi:hypothetical protein AMR41_26235 [Hapalosiphon sp. MRB220]|nr:hypothetical protein AMR41_26235 [Hapalosiphon sp. MRB220]
MRFANKPIIKPLLALNAVALICTTVVVVSERVRSDTSLTKRSKGLEILANHVLSKSCWTSFAEDPYKISDVITTNGSVKGRIPTSCIFVPATQQFLQVGYLNGDLQVLHVYSRQELKNQISQIKEGKDGTRR